MGSRKFSKVLFIIALSLIQLSNIKAETFKTLDIDDSQSNQLWKLSQLYSCARYFSPVTNTDDIDWYAFLDKNIQEIVTVNSIKQADSVLLNNFSLLLPELNFVRTSEINNKVAVAPFFIKVTTLNTGFQKSPTTSHLIRMENNDMQLPEYYHIKLDDNVAVSYRMIIDRVDNNSEKLKPLLKRYKYKWEKDFYTSPYFRLSNAIILGAYIQHFYAYYDEDNLAVLWEKEMKDYFKKIASCSSYSEYLNASFELYGHVKDGHLFVMNGYSKPGALIGKYHPIYYPQILLGLSDESSIYVKEYGTDCGIRKGDEILSVNGQNIKALIDKKKKIVSAATEADRIGKVLDMFMFQSFKKDSVIQLTVKRADQQQHICNITINHSDNYFVRKDDFISQVQEGIWRINPCLEEGASYKEFSKYINQFKDAKGLIIDLRGYPNSCILPILSHFIDTTAMVGQILTPTFYAPNHHYVNYQITENSKWGIHPSTELYRQEWEYEKPVAKRIKTPVYFLSDRNALSFGETIVELIKSHNIGTIIGEPTSGTNGDAVIVKSPSMGYIFTGYKFLNHDGSQHHGVGVIPDIECKQKMSDIQQGEDTLIKLACNLILKQK